MLTQSSVFRILSDQVCQYARRILVTQFIEEHKNALKRQTLRYYPHSIVDPSSFAYSSVAFPCCLNLFNISIELKKSLGVAIWGSSNRHLRISLAPNSTTGIRPMSISRANCMSNSGMLNSRAWRMV